MTQQTRSRYLDYLPAIYHQHPFLGQFLLPFEEVLAGFEGLLDTIDHYFAPALTDGEFLPWLATWVALVLDEEWDETKRRRLISEAVELYRWRGTVYGLKRYLEIYAGLVPEIREWSWPGGMQIGVASQIGSITPPDASLARIEEVSHRQPPQYDSYYVVDTVDIQGEPRRLYYNTADVERVAVNDDGSVDLWLFAPGGGPSTLTHHAPATITRRDRLVDDLYSLTVESEGGPQSVEYQGNTLLIDEIELPYRFVVDVRVPLEDLDSVKLDKVRAIVDLEKPAHTMYYLKLTPVASRYTLERMQIGVRSSIGLDTTVG
jgi:phage tail-like protein